MAEKIFTEGEEGRRIKLEPSFSAYGGPECLYFPNINRDYP